MFILRATEYTIFDDYNSFATKCNFELPVELLASQSGVILILTKITL
jgi:hypothetical protein